jgi:hypothetical protein
VAQTQPEPLNPDDAAILALESEAIAGHTMKVVVLEPGERPLTLESLRESVAARLDTERRARQRVEVPAAEPATPRWVTDDDFDIRAHVGAREGAEGRGDETLWALAGELMSERLDHRRPLWALDLLGPLADGRQAIVARIHHAMADGISSVRFLEGVLWDAAAAPAPAHRPAATGDRPARSQGTQLRRLPGAVRRELGGHAPRSRLDRPIGSARAVAFTTVPLAGLRRVGGSRPGHATVNDVLLAGVAGGLRRWLAGDRLPALRAQVPVSLHHRDEGERELGNRDSFLNVDLPLGERDPLARLDLITAETSKRKQLGDAEELYDFFHALARFKRLERAIERHAASPSEFSLSVSNVPGPRGGASVGGQAVESLFSVAEPADRHALRVSAISCGGSVGVGLCTDPYALPGVGDLASAIDAAFAELHALAIQ